MDNYSDRCEKVIKGLMFTKAMITFNPLTGEDIEPGNLNEEDKISYDACVSAIALLKEQEAVQPVRGEDDDFYCGRCGKKIAITIKIYDGYSFVKTHPDHMKPECKCNFCKYCGQAVKWE